MKEKEQIDRTFGIFRTIMSEQPKGQLIDFEREKARLLAKRLIDETPPRTPNRVA